MCQEHAAKQTLPPCTNTTDSDNSSVARDGECRAAVLVMADVASQCRVKPSQVVCCVCLCLCVCGDLVSLGIKRMKDKVDWQ